MGNFYMESTQINYRRDEKLKTVDQKLQELSETSAIDTDIAPVFKSTNTYQPGDMVYYRNKLYVFNVEHTGAWAAADVTATDVTTELSSLKSGLTDVLGLSQVYGSLTAFPFTPTKTGIYKYGFEAQAATGGKVKVEIMDTTLNEMWYTDTMHAVEQYENRVAFIPMIAGHTYTETFTGDGSGHRTTWLCKYIANS